MSGTLPDPSYSKVLRASLMLVPAMGCLLLDMNGPQKMWFEVSVHHSRGGLLPLQTLLVNPPELWRQVALLARRAGEGDDRRVPGQCPLDRRVEGPSPNVSMGMETLESTSSPTIYRKSFF